MRVVCTYWLVAVGAAEEIKCFKVLGVPSNIDNENAIQNAYQDQAKLVQPPNRAMEDFVLLEEAYVHDVVGKTHEVSQVYQEAWTCHGLSIRLHYCTRSCVRCSVEGDPKSEEDW